MDDDSFFFCIVAAFSGGDFHCLQIKYHDDRFNEESWFFKAA